MTQRFRTPRRMAAVAVLCAAGLSACGSTTSPATPAGTFATSVAPSKVAAEVTTVTELADRVSAAVSAKGTARVSIRAEGLTSEGVVDLGGETLEMDMTTSIAAGELRFVVAGTGLYVLGTKSLEGTKTPWGRIDLSQMELTGGAGSVLSNVGGPDSVLGPYRDAPLSVVDTVDGVTQYRLDVPIADYLAAKNKTDLLEKAREAIGETIEVRYSVDSSFLPVRLEEVQTKTIVTYSDWGKPVTIKAPPADQVTEMAP